MCIMEKIAHTIYHKELHLNVLKDKTPHEVDSLSRTLKESVFELSLYKDNFQLAYSLLHDPDNADLIVQESVDAVIEKCREIIIFNFASYLYITTKRKCINCLQKQNRVVDLEGRQIPTVDPESEELSNKRESIIVEAYAQFVKFLETINGKEGMIFSARFLNKIPSKKIEEKTNIKVSTIDSIYFRTKKKYKDYLKKNVKI